MKNEKSVKTTSKKALHRFAAAASVLLAVCLVFMMPVSAETYECPGHEGWQVLNSDTTITSGTKYYLNNDLELSSSLTIPENAQVTLCLNGKTLKAAEGKTISIITVSKGAVLNLTDCNENKAGKITGGKGTTDSNYELKFGGGIYIPSNGKVNMYDGNITSCSADIGGGVHVGPGSTFTMYGGTISECEADSNNAGHGGGVSVLDGGIFTMYSGKIIYCKSERVGGGVAVIGLKKEGSAFTLAGGTIENCEAVESGGGVNIDGGSFVMSSGTISKCKTTSILAGHGSGGGVAMKYNIHDLGDSSFTMSGGSISDCTATGNGGGVDVPAKSGTFEMSGTSSISNCDANKGGGVSVTIDAEFSMEDSSSISGCTATGNGGGVSMSGGTFEVSGSASITPADGEDGVFFSGTTENHVITIPEGETFSGSISGIKSHSNSDEDKDRELIKVEGTIGEGAKITGSSDDSSEDGDGTVSLIEFTVTWKNSDGSVLKIDTGVRYGTTLTYNGATPTKASNETHSFTFAGWTPEVAASVTKNAEYTATFTAVEIPPAPSSSSSSSKGSDSGNYQYFPREVTADGIISFGSSKVVKGMELPAGSFGRVTLNTMPDFEMPENGFYAFEIDAPGYNLDAKINGGLSFQIKAADLEEEGWTAEDIVLFHGTVAEDGTITWEALPTSLVEVENGIAYYKAVINGCSPFYIGFVEDGSIVNEPVVEPSDEPTDVPQDVPGEDLPDIPGVQDEPEEPSTPAPILAVLAGLGAAVVLRRK